ncbi:MAG: hypothetical protein R2788_05585 [Saprospiraceae bacterium]
MARATAGQVSANFNIVTIMTSSICISARASATSPLSLTKAPSMKPCVLFDEVDAPANRTDM